LRAHVAEPKLIYRLIQALVVLGFVAVVVSVWVPGLPMVIGVLALLAAAGVTVLERSRPAHAEKPLDPLLREGPLLGPLSGGDPERSVHSVDEFATLARSEGMAEFGEAMTQERLRAQSQAERDVSLES